VRSAVARRWYSATAPSVVAESHWPALPFVTWPVSSASTLPPAASTRKTAAVDLVVAGDVDARHAHAPLDRRLGDRAADRPPAAQAERLRGADADRDAGHAGHPRRRD
jgi:hypothetical protein